MNVPTRRTNERVRELRLDERFFPPLRVRHPVAFDLDKVTRDFMLDVGQAAGPPTAPFRPLELDVRHLDIPGRGDVDRFRMPEFGRFYRGPRPAQVYDLAALRFRPLRGSTLWLSDRIPDGSNYLANAFRPLITHACATLGHALLHSALVEHRGRGLLLPGEAFSGKSSLSFFGLMGGARLVSDDLVLVARHADGFLGRGFRSIFLLRERTRERVDESLRSLGEPVRVGGTPKYVYTREALGDRVAAVAPVSAVVFPCIDEGLEDGDFRLAPLGKSAAVATLLRCADTTVLMPGLDAERAAVTRTLLALASERPCLRLTMGRGFLADPADSAGRAFDAVLESLPRSGRTS